MHYRERRCPHCGRTNGLVSKYFVEDVRTYYDFNGNKREDCMDDSEKIGGKNLHCQVCERFVCKEEDYQDIYGQVNEDLSNERTLIT